FQYARAAGDLDLLRRLADHAIARHHPGAADAANPYLALFESVRDAQASLVAQWMLVGFVHGVMNTDNTTISGETIDYGPCAFLDAFDPGTVFSSIDHRGRYAYGNQPAVAQWNLARLAEALLPLVDPDEERAVTVLTEAVSVFGARHDAAWTAGMRAKLGLPAAVDDATARSLFTELLTVLTRLAPDHTLFFRRLTSLAGGDRHGPTRCTCRATTSSRRPSTPPSPVTSPPSAACSRSSPGRTPPGPGWSATPSPPRRAAAPSSRTAAPDRRDDQAWTPGPCSSSCAPSCSAAYSSGPAGWAPGWSCHPRSCCSSDRSPGCC